MNLDACMSTRVDVHIAANGSVVKCPPGLVANEFWTGCTGVTAGTYADGVAIIHRQPLPAALNLGTPCSPGTFAASGGASSCTPCAAGSFVSSTGAARCTVCPTNSYCPTIGMIAPLPCLPGSISSGGAAVCTLCPPGTAGNGTSCTPCDKTQELYSPAAGGTACVPCRGAFDAVTGNCSACGLGAYFAGEGCATCPLGRVNVLDIWASSSSACLLSCPLPTQYAAAADSCLEAPLGYVPTPGAITPIPCSQGRYRGAGMTACEACSPGSYSASAASACSLCQPGTYSAAAASICTQCASGLFAGSQGSPSAVLWSLCGITVANRCVQDKVPAAPA